MAVSFGKDKTILQVPPSSDVKESLPKATLFFAISQDFPLMPDLAIVLNSRS